MNEDWQRAEQFRLNIVRPIDQYMGLHSPASEALLMMTAIHESGGLVYYEQIRGPAKSFFQIEPRTRKDIHENFLVYRPALQDKVAKLVAVYPSLDEQLETNLAYATAIARLVYYRDRQPLPHKDDLMGLAQYWKRVYNTHLGAGEPEDCLKAYKEVYGL